MEHFFDTIYDYISWYLFCDRYNQDDVFYINPFDIDEIIEVHTLEEAGYDLNDDGSVYRDSNGRPVNTNNDDYYHLVDDIITFDETGKRVPNVEYIDKLVLRYLGVK